MTEEGYRRLLAAMAECSVPAGWMTDKRDRLVFVEKPEWTGFAFKVNNTGELIVATGAGGDPSTRCRRVFDFVASYMASVRRGYSGPSWVDAFGNIPEFSSPEELELKLAVRAPARHNSV